LDRNPLVSSGKCERRFCIRGRVRDRCLLSSHAVGMVRFDVHALRLARMAESRGLAPGSTATATRLPTPRNRTRRGVRRNANPNKRKTWFRSARVAENGVP
jgi:hypothetical protein